MTDTTGSFLEIFPQWFINGEPANLNLQGPFEVVLPPAAPNNLTVVSSFVPFSVSCRTSFYPNIDLGVFQICEC
ncbi:MAG: hypothetical protein MJE68_29995, partial [Proteobacteria bacterium]|nr:hypothetical protein [Pseudomonadota bacterium]